MTSHPSQCQTSTTSTITANTAKSAAARFSMSRRLISVFPVWFEGKTGRKDNPRPHASRFQQGLATPDTTSTDTNCRGKIGISATLQSQRLPRFTAGCGNYPSNQFISVSPITIRRRLLSPLICNGEGGLSRPGRPPNPIQLPRAIHIPTRRAAMGGPAFRGGFAGPLSFHNMR